MTLIVNKGLIFKNLIDSDALSYINAVETADLQSLEPAVKSAINSFIVGCKADGIWDAIKASCIMAGARTLAGALVPLKGAAPTNFNFVAGDYDRKTGLVGNGSNKYLDSNRNNNADPQNSKHLAVYVSTAGTLIERVFIAASTGTGGAGSSNLGVWSAPYTFTRINSSIDSGPINSGTMPTGFVGASRSSVGILMTRAFALNFSKPSTSQTPLNANITVFSEPGPAFTTNARLSFYSIGEAIDLALLDARVTTLMNALAAAIP